MSCWAHKLFDLTKNFHVYGCEWTPTYIKIYFDGVCVRTFKDKKVLEWFNQPLMVIIGNGIDENSLNTATFPNTHRVDYVKIYKKIQ
jgi:Glycosyl hydrolases family 16.